MPRTLITRARLLALHPGADFFEAASLVLEDGRIVAILEDPAPADAHADRVDAGGGLVLPGLVNAHTHAYSAFARGLSHSVVARDFAELLQNLWWRLDAALDPEDVRLSAALTARDGLRLGVTTVFDHHASYGTIAGALDAVGAGFAAAGQRAVLCFEVSDRAGRDAARAAIAENVRFARQAPVPPFLVGAMLGLHASFTLSDETLRAAAEAAHDLALRIHIHLAEDPVDHVAGTKHGSGVVARLEEHGLLRPGSIVAHAVHVDDAERRRLGELGIVVVHNPRSNMNNGVGRCDLGALVRAGVQVGLGTDGFGAGMLAEARVATLVQRQAPRAGEGGAVRESLLAGNVDLAAAYVPGIGRLAPGAPADVVVTDYVPPTPLGAENAWGHLLFGEIEARVRHVFVGGELVVEDGRNRRLDEAALDAQCRERAAALWDRFAAAARVGGAR